jgi:hypothetical protein
MLLRMVRGRFVEQISKTGATRRAWEPNPVARILEQILGSVVFLYNSEDAANKGEKYGGSGFLVSVPSEKVKGQQHPYVVTNQHLAGNGFTVVRMTFMDGKVLIVPTKESEWVDHPSGDDISVCGLSLAATQPLHTVPLSMCLSPVLDILVQDIGPGSEVFMVGRFITSEGKQRNNPMVRFGNIAMMPEKIEVAERAFSQESFLIECHSISGFSGSPVFVHNLPGSLRPDQWSPLDSPVRADFVNRGYTIKLLGVDWGHIQHYDSVVDKGGKPHPDGWRVRSNTAIMGAVPAWKLSELILNNDELKEQRMREDKRLAEELMDSKAVLDVNAEEPEFTKKDFEDALRKVSRKVQPDKQ